MMAARIRPASLLERLPEVRGRYSEDVSLAGMTWFRVGGPAEVLFRPADAEDLSAFLAGKPDDVAVTVIGVGSNLLVRDGGVPGVTVRLGRGLAAIAVRGTELEAGAAALDRTVAATAAAAGIAGLEFLSGIPGTIGGALRMNAGAHGVEMKDVTVSARAVDGQGRVRELSAGDIGFGYRESSLAGDWTFLSAVLRGRPGETADIARGMETIAAARRAVQPPRAPTGGSTFRNPPGKKAWEFIEKAGCRGLRRGGAQVSEKHCNFLINTGDATAADIEGLGEEVRRRVLAATGVTLEWEIHRIGVSPPGLPVEVGS